MAGQGGVWPGGCPVGSLTINPDCPAPPPRGAEEADSSLQVGARWHPTVSGLSTWGHRLTGPLWVRTGHLGVPPAAQSAKDPHLSSGSASLNGDSVAAPSA